MFWRIFSQLIRRDLVIYRKEYAGKILDMLITFIVWNTVFGYLMPSMGTRAGYGVFIMVGAVTSFGIFEIIGKASNLINDMRGDRTISYLLLLPIPTYTIFCYIAISWAIQSMLAAIPLFFVGKALFWEQFDLGNITWWRLLLAFLSTQLFYGFFALWVSSAMIRIRDLTSIYFRFLNPLFIFGCYFFPWETAFKLSKTFGVIVLFDPLTYVMEIMRASVLGQEGFLPFWLSFGVIWVFSAACGSHAIRRLKRHLDCL
jgi:ABC-2 type transport system permease protein